VHLSSLFNSVFYNIKNQIGFFEEIVHIDCVLIKLNQKLILVQLLLLLAEHLKYEGSPNIFRHFFNHRIKLSKTQLLTHLLV